MTEMEIETTKEFIRGYLYAQIDKVLCEPFEEFEEFAHKFTDNMSLDRIENIYNLLKDYEKKINT